MKKFKNFSFKSISSISNNGGKDIYLSKYNKFYGFFAHNKKFWISAIHDPVAGKTISKGRFDGEDAAQYDIAICVVGRSNHDFNIIFMLKNRYTEEESTYCIGENEEGNDPVAGFYIIGDSNNGAASMKAHWVIENAARKNVCCYSEMFIQGRKSRLEFICRLIEHFVPSAIANDLLIKEGDKYR